MSNLDLIRGRQVVAYLTNKSGGAIVAGDVVIMDGSNDESFTTTTSASSLKKVGVAQESIANNAQGRVLIAGYASLVNVSASATRDYYLFTHTVAKQATSSATFAQGAFGHVIKAGTSPSALIYDETAQTGAGSAYSGVTWSSGTAMPGSPSTNQRITRTDLGLDFYYDGTRWLSVQLYKGEGNGEPAIPISATATIARWGAWGGDYDLWLDSVEVLTYHASITGTNYWSFDVLKGTVAEVETSLGTFVTSGDTSSNWTQHKITVGALIGTTHRYIRAAATKNAAATALYAVMGVRYRLVGT